MPVYNELGRAYSFLGQYEDANKQFEAARVQKTEYTNFKHLNITLSYQSDNYKRWAEEFIRRKDYDEGKKMLYKSLETIKEASRYIKHDKKNQILEKKIAKDIGIIFLKTGDFDKGKQCELGVKPIHTFVLNWCFPTKTNSKHGKKAWIGNYN